MGAAGQRRAKVARGGRRGRRSAEIGFRPYYNLHPECPPVRNATGQTVGPEGILGPPNPYRHPLLVTVPVPGTRHPIPILLI